MYVYLYLINSNQRKMLVRKIIYPDITLSFLHRAFIKYRMCIYIYNIDIYVSIYKLSRRNKLTAIKLFNKNRKKEKQKDDNMYLSLLLIPLL